MSTNSSSADYGRFEVLAEEFAARFRRGERPSLQEYIERCPDLADEIRELFPALVEVERVKEERPSPPGATQAAALPALGQVGDYRVLREVGRGGMGVVYEAEQVSLGRRVALKVLPRQVSQDLKTLARFRREARSAAQLHHTNIVPVFEVGKDGEVSYYAMQFIQGQGLDLVINELRRLKDGAHPSGPDKNADQALEKISSGSTVAAVSRSRQASDMALSLLTGRFVSEPPSSAERNASAATDRRDGVETHASPTSNLAPASVLGSSSAVVLPGGSQLSAVESGRRPFFRSVASIGRQVAAGLSYAHARGIVHRDIKPSNLLLDTQGVVWITDFGLAKASDDGLTQTGDILGTLRYMAPERFRGDGDGRADVYALGLTLYELLTLRPAFDSPDRLELIERIKAEDPPRPRALDSRIPRDLETIVLKAIAKDPRGRYPTAAALGEDLQRFVEDRPIRARRASVAERFDRWCRRNPVVAGLLSAIFLLLAMVAGVASVGYVQTKRALSAAKVAESNAHGEAARAGAAEKEMRQQWYAAAVNLMQSAWDTGQVRRLRALLAESESYPDRGFEWYYCQRLRHLEQHTLIGHRAKVSSVSWSPDGKRLATASSDGTAKIWDAVGGRELIPFRYSGPLDAVSWSPDGTRLATGGWDGAARVWDAAGGRELFPLKGHTGPVGSVAWSPDGKRLATGSEDGTAKVWDAAGGRELFPLKGHTGQVWSVAWSRDGRRLATGSEDGTAKVWDGASSRELFSLMGHTGSIFSIAWSPDGKRLATGSWDGTAKVWDAVGRSELLTLKGHTGQVLSVAWSPDGTRLATGSWDGTAKIWDAAGGREPITLRGHAGQVFSVVWSVTWSPDGARLATGSEDGTAKVWDAAGGGKPLVIEAPTNVNVTIAWSPDGARLATGILGRTAKVWDAAAGRELLTLKGHTDMVHSVSWSPDGARLATGSDDYTAKVWDAAGGRELLTLKGHTGPVWSVAWSPDGRRLATGSSDGTAKVWDAADGREPVTLRGHASAVLSVAWSPDSRRLASGSIDGTAIVWDAAGGRQLFPLKGHTSLVWSVAWSPDGARLATGSFDGTAKVWDAAGGRPLFPLEGHAGPVFSVAWSPDGARLATGSFDGAAKVWDAAGGRELLTLKGHAGRVFCVAWSPDGRRLATRGRDGTAMVCEAADAEAVQEWARQDRAVQDLRDRDDISSPRAQGFLQDWLLLLPLPWAVGETMVQALDRHQIPDEGRGVLARERELAAQALDRQQILDEAQARPRAGDRVPLGGRELVWREHRSPEAFVDFNAAAGQLTERSVAYAVCYIESDRERHGLWLQVGYDDWAKVYLNGGEIYRSRSRRFLTPPPLPLEGVGPVRLERGINVLLLKVVNERDWWQGCARLVDDAGRPAEGLRVKLTP
jgi:WD40 repeat protein/serine/threonine protein kinase